MKKETAHLAQMDCRCWLQERQLAQRPRLLEQMQVDDGWQLAVETVLGSDLQAVCVDSIDGISDLLASLEQGSVSLVEAGTEQAAAPGSLADERSDRIPVAMTKRLRDVSSICSISGRPD